MNQTRNEWIDLLTRIAEPVLVALEEERLALTFPAALHLERAEHRCLEALGRTMCGIAPWLELEGVEGTECEIQARFRRLARVAIDRATDPCSADYMSFARGPQSLVDAAFLSHAILRAPRELYDKMEARVKGNLITSLKASRAIKPFRNNWLLFAATVEAALSRMGEEIDTARVDDAVDHFKSEWYVGDGTYSDGKNFHFDYYNSFVIQPMYLDVVRSLTAYAPLLPEAQKRAARYAAILERMIAPDGTYPIVGRSICYRFGAFQLLSQAALQGFLPEEIAPSQVRCALSAVMKRCEAGGMFDEQGWLLPGVCGYQPDLAEPYINTGSLYLCSSVFLALGLPPAHPFWSDPDRMWTTQKIWAGVNMMRDRAVD